MEENHGRKREKKVRRKKISHYGLEVKKTKQNKTTNKQTKTTALGAGQLELRTVQIKHSKR